MDTLKFTFMKFTFFSTQLVPGVFINAVSCVTNEDTEQFHHPKTFLQVKPLQSDRAPTWP